jgi:hypothetical protein
VINPHHAAPACLAENKQVEAARAHDYPTPSPRALTSVKTSSSSCSLGADTHNVRAPRFEKILEGIQQLQRATSVIIAAAAQVFKALSREPEPATAA